MKRRSTHIWNLTKYQFCQSKENPHSVRRQSKSEEFDSCDFSSRMTLKFNGWPRKTIGHLFYTMSSFVYHFKSNGEFKLELQSANAHFGSKMAILLCHVTLKLDGWPWKTIGLLFYTTLSFVHHFKAIAEFKLELKYGNAYFGSKLSIIVPYELEIWRITLKTTGHFFYAASSFVHYSIAIN